MQYEYPKALGACAKKRTASPKNPCFPRQICHTRSWLSQGANRAMKSGAVTHKIVIGIPRLTPDLGREIPIHVNTKLGSIYDAKRSRI